MFLLALVLIVISFIMLIIVVYVNQDYSLLYAAIALIICAGCKIQPLFSAYNLCGVEYTICNTQLHRPRAGDKKKTESVHRQRKHRLSEQRFEMGNAT